MAHNSNDYSNYTSRSTTDKAQDIAQDVKGQAQQTAAEAKSQAGAVANQAQEQVKQTVAQQTSQAAQQLAPVVDALRQTGQTLNDQNQPLGQYANQAADQIEQVQNYLRSANLDQMMHDARDMARRQPELFVGAAFTAGLMLARFMKSSNDANYGVNRQFQPPANYGYYQPTYNPTATQPSPTTPARRRTPDAERL